MKTKSFSRLIGLGTPLAKMLKDRVLSPEKEGDWRSTRELVTALGELKGAAMKLGQMLSITQDLVLPPEVSALFASLQKTAPPMPDHKLDAVFMQSFGKRPEDVFGRFERRPMAAASIGQVHRAWTKQGKKLAVKVQYPDVVKAIEADFKNIDTLKKIVKLMVKNPPEMEPILEEMRLSILAECDYEQEAKWMNHFRQLTQENFPHVMVPEVIGELSSKTVLSMQLVEGDDFAQTLKYEPAILDKLGETLLEFHMQCFYLHGLLHTDPQNGNYLFTREGKIILLDFGSVREFPLEFRLRYKALFRAIEAEDQMAYRMALLDLKVFEEDDPPELFATHMLLAQTLYAPFRRKGRHAFQLENPIPLAKEFMKNISLEGRRSPRQEFVLLDRANLGLFTKLRAWKSQVDLYETKEKVFCRLERP